MDKNIKSIYIASLKSPISAQLWRFDNMTEIEDREYSEFLVSLDAVEDDLEYKLPPHRRPRK
jgi:hypothetical protein